MTTNNVDVPAASGSAHSAQPSAPPAGSSARLVVLLALLATVIGAYAYDYFVALPKCDATFNKIQEFVDARNKLGVKDGALVTPDDLHKEIGMGPTSVEKHNDKQYEVEYYCWWGPIPLLNKRRHFISVVFVGQDPKWRFSSHHRNEVPPEEALPVSYDEKDMKESEPLPEPQSAGAAPKASGESTSVKAADASPAESKEPPSEPKAADEK